MAEKLQHVGTRTLIKQNVESLLQSIKSMETSDALTAIELLEPATTAMGSILSLSFPRCW